MLETAAVPILLQAVNFLFEESKNILQERRERRKKQAEDKDNAKKKAAPTSAAAEKAAPPEEDASAVSVIRSKENAIHTPVSRSAWQEAETDVDHLLTLLEIHKRNYYRYREQKAKWGEAMVPPIIENGLKDEEDNIVRVAQELEQLLAQVYARPVSAPELDYED